MAMHCELNDPENFHSVRKQKEELTRQFSIQNYCYKLNCNVINRQTLWLFMLFDVCCCLCFAHVWHNHGCDLQLKHILFDLIEHFMRNVQKNGKSKRMLKILLMDCNWTTNRYQIQNQSIIIEWTGANASRRIKYSQIKFLISYFNLYVNRIKLSVSSSEL